MNFYRPSNCREYLTNHPSNDIQNNNLAGLANSFSLDDYPRTCFEKVRKMEVLYIYTSQEILRSTPLSITTSLEMICQEKKQRPSYYSDLIQKPLHKLWILTKFSARQLRELTSHLSKTFCRFVTLRTSIFLKYRKRHFASQAFFLIPNFN